MARQESWAIRDSIDSSILRAASGIDPTSVIDTMTQWSRLSRRAGMESQWRIHGDRDHISAFLMSQSRAWRRHIHRTFDLRDRHDSASDYRAMCHGPS